MSTQNAEVARLRAEVARLRAKAKVGFSLYFDALRSGVEDRSELCGLIQALKEQLEAAAAAAPAFERPLKQLRALLESTQQSLECPVCLQKLRPAITNKTHESYMVIFGCGHLVCNRCAHSLKAVGTEDCPECRREIKSSLEHLRPIDPDADEKEVTPEDVGLSAAEPPPRDALPSRFPGNCKACFEEIKREALIVPSSQAKRVFVHLGCRDVPLKDCHHCGRKFAGEDRVLGKYKDRILACNDCGVAHKWAGAKRLPPLAPKKPASKRAKTASTSKAAV